MNWESLNQYSVFFCAALAVILIVLIIITVKFNTRLRNAERRYQTLTRGIDGADWHDLMLVINDDIASLKSTCDNHEKYLQNLDARTKIQFCHRAVIHYDAFEHIFGQLSFSVALLDENYNGFIFSNIHGREDARCYLKEVKDGKCEQFLSDEEKVVLTQATKGE